MRWNINRFFNPENRFWAFMERVTDICVLSFFWFLFSIPVVTAGAATTALFQYIYASSDCGRGGIRLEDLPGGL